MPVAFDAIPSVLTGTESATGRFIRRLFLKTSEAPELYSWQNTLLQLDVNKIPKAFAAANDVFVEFVNDPTKENFDAWREKLATIMEDEGVTEDWNSSYLYMALINTKFRDLITIGEIEPFANVKDVRDAPFDDPTFGLCPRAFATVVFAVAELAECKPTMVDIAESLLGDVEDGEDNDEEDDAEDDDEDDE